jgi:AcrR family transcriptional regulator
MAVSVIGSGSSGMRAQMTLIDKIVNSKLAEAPRRRRLPEAARDNVLDAAERMLITSGPQSLKLTEVARAAGVSNATVLHHFGSIDDVQTGLMQRMVRDLVATVLAINDQVPDAFRSSGEAVAALFDAFESRGAARLAAWLELTGEARRLTVVREAVREVMDRRVEGHPEISREAMEDFTLASIVLALGVGLFGPTIGELMDKPRGRARQIAIAMLLDQLQQALVAGPPGRV